MAAHASDPRYSPWITDPENTLSAEAATAVYTLLTEHEQSTGEILRVGVLSDLEKASLDAWVQADQPPPAHAVYLGIAPQRSQAEVLAGIEIEPKIPAAQSRHLLRQVIEPLLRARTQDRVDRAVVKGIQGLFEILNSPLLPSGRVEEVLQALPKPLPELSPPSSSKTWMIPVLLGFVLLIFVMIQLLSREAHFTESGWVRVTTRFSTVLEWWKERGKKSPHNPDSIGGGSSGDW